jgi:hypothetical protein
VPKEHPTGKWSLTITPPRARRVAVRLPDTPASVAAGPYPFPFTHLLSSAPHKKYPPRAPNLAHSPDERAPTQARTPWHPMRGSRCRPASPHSSSARCSGRPAPPRPPRRGAAYLRWRARARPRRAVAGAGSGLAPPRPSRRGGCSEETTWSTATCFPTAASTGRSRSP